MGCSRPDQSRSLRPVRYKIKLQRREQVGRAMSRKALSGRAASRVLPADRVATGGTRWAGLGGGGTFRSGSPGRTGRPTAAGLSIRALGG